MVTTEAKTSHNLQQIPKFFLYNFNGLIGIHLASTTVNMHTWRYKFLPFFPLSFVVPTFTFTFVCCPTQLTVAAIVESLLSSQQG